MSQEETIIIAKNLTSSSVDLPQLALTVPALGTVSLTEFNEVYEIRGDNDLYNLVVSGTIVLNDGFVDFDTTGSLNYLNPPTFSSSIGDLFAASSSFQSQIDGLVGGTTDPNFYIHTAAVDVFTSSINEQTASIQLFSASTLESSGTFSSDIDILTAASASFRSDVDSLFETSGTLSENINQLNAASASFRIDIDSNDAEISILQAASASYRSEIDVLTAASSSFRTELDSVFEFSGTLSDDVDRLDAASASFRSEINTLTAGSGTFRSELDSLFESSGTFSLDLDRLDAASASFRVDIDSNDVDISRLDAASASFRSEVDVLTDASASFRGEVDVLTAGSASFRSELDVLTAGSASFRTELDIITAASATFRSEIDGLFDHSSSVKQHTASVRLVTGSLFDQTASIQEQTASIQLFSASVQLVTASLFEHTSSVNDITGSLLEITGAILASTGTVLVSNDDTTLDYLINKIIPASGVIITEVSGGANEKLEIGIPEEDDFATVQKRRTTTLTIPTSFADIEFDTTDIENNSTVVSGSSANSDEITILEDGLYKVQYNATIFTDGDSAMTFTLRGRVNDTTTIPGSEISIEEPDAGKDTSTNVSQTFYYLFTAGDFVTIQIDRSGGSGTYRIEEGATFSIQQQKGRPGADGVDGEDGVAGTPGPTGSGTTINVYDDGTLVPNSPFSELNFIGDLSASDAGSGRVDIEFVGSSGGGDFESYTAYDGAGSQTFTGNTTINLDTELTSSSNYSLSSDEVTVNTAGRYLISYQVSIEATGGGRSQGQCWLELNSVEVDGTRGTIYVRQNNFGGTAGATIVLQLAASDVLRLRATRTTGGGTFSPEINGSRLTIVRLAD